ncbi:EF-hand domain-containing protein [Planktothrix serta]|nr:hypothetical protein [Planktothrix serta]
MALTELQKRKFKAAFDSQDLDGSGVLTNRDFDGFLAQIQRGIPVSGRLISSLHSQWYEIQSKADLNGDGEVTLEEWYQYLDDVIHDESRFYRQIMKTIQTLLNSLDTDEDKNITKQEYVIFSRSVGVGIGDALTAFEKLDSNGNGSISIDELIGHIEHFYLNEDDENAPSNWLFGKF